ncbi:hypothetical protein [Curtobacterium sp. MCSS17_007]|uniref:hypothetical protein n=1 Tax=Curtobacterium sp. MCSS17_007 TaxID=2175646 RepID=UPI0015E8E26A|nr:hypothetical protein [Curtobacterium sp. MCSS17_007]WIE76608.1 hypothetical protein DEJ22_004920 [Curtobacterium sp. MCSS17_007]
MFEYEGMQTAAALLSPGAEGASGHDAPARPAVRSGAGRPTRRVDHLGDARAALERITALRSRVAEMEAPRVDVQGLPTATALQPLLPGGAIRVGGAYAVQESVLLAMTMLQAASAEGAWCAVVGVPSFGVEAAAAMGIDLERLVLVPDPGDQWLTVTAALADVAQIVLTRPLGRVAPGDVSRLSARLRQRGGALVALGSWPGADVTLRVTESVWSGIGDGHGHLAERRATVTASGRAGAGRPVSADLLLPAADGAVRPAVVGAAGASGGVDSPRVLRPVAVAS